jgi:hypothetical protein
MCDDARLALAKPHVVRIPLCRSRFEMIKVDYGDQVQWPDLLQDTEGAQIRFRRGGQVAGRRRPL